MEKSIIKRIHIIILTLLVVFTLNKEIKNIKYEEDNSIGILTIKYADDTLDINNEDLNELENILDTIDINKIRVLILTDNSSKKDNNIIKCDKMENINNYNVIKKLEQIEIPIISLINNYALGIMFELFLTADIKICSQEAILGYPLFESAKKLFKLIGSGMSKQIIYAKQIINSKEALRIGLVNKIYPDTNLNELIKNAKEFSKLIINNGNNAIKKSKLAINEGTKYIENNKNIFKLKCAVQNYDWGKSANNSLVATALRKNGEPIDETKKYAEYWMGTHPNGPSKIIKNNEEILLSNEIKGQLPYLFKILSISKPLSIQLHPDKTFAEILHRKYPKIYKDDNHKPELFIALSDFELLFGLVELNKAIEVIKKFKNCLNLKEGEKLIEEPNVENYKKFIEKIISLEKEEYEKILKLILDTQEAKNNMLIIKLYENFGLDKGILVSLFMNHLHKKKAKLFL